MPAKKWTGTRPGVALVVVLASVVIVSLSERCPAAEYGGSLMHGDVVLQRAIGGSLQATPDTPITVTVDIWGAA